MERSVALSPEMRRLQNRWQTGAGWPRRLEALEITGLRGWTSQRVDFNFPIVAIVGENGSGKSTIIQCAASVYQGDNIKLTHFPSDFFPDTPWERVTAAEIKYTYRDPTKGRPDRDLFASSLSRYGVVRKTEVRWRGYSNRPHRSVEHIDLSRVQPVSARTGFARLANPQLKEATGSAWDETKVALLSQIMGRRYATVRMAKVVGDKRSVPVLSATDSPFSGFHTGAGETTMVEFLHRELKPTSLLLIDEIETSLHPRVQRLIVRKLAEICRTQDIQIILTTHSPTILEELPLEARVYILKQQDGTRQVVTGVSPEFAMTKMDEEQHPECDVYVEDSRAEIMLNEVLVAHKPALWDRCLGIPYGSAQVGYALGLMAAGNRFPRPTCVFVDGDQEPKDGCFVLPGGDAPERVVFEALNISDWAKLHERLNRSYPDVADACKHAMTFTDHHGWVRLAADRLLLSSGVLWQAMCGEWARTCLTQADADSIIAPIEAALASAGQRSRQAKRA
jgi:predicted ATPase